MTIFNLGSINIDTFYCVPHLPVTGETLAASDMIQGLGGKGANMSVAAARAGAHVCHIGAVGADGVWARDRMTEYGVDTRYIETVDVPTGRAIIMIDDAAQNSIILMAGANRAIPQQALGAALSLASPGDTLLMQNETTHQVEAAKMAKTLGLRVTYAAAPFKVEAVMPLLPYLDFLILNEVEAEQLLQEAHLTASQLPVADVIVTKGAKGACYFDNTHAALHEFSAHPVKAVDTTGAGDTFTGYVLAALDRGLTMAQAITLATRASALMVMRQGTADAIPDLKEVETTPL